MIDLLRWALQRHERSKETAHQRLHVILIMDRIGMSSETLDAMKTDFLEVVSRYLVVDEESIEMDMRRTEDSLVLVSNIHVRDVVRTLVPG